MKNSKKIDKLNFIPGLKMVLFFLVLFQSKINYAQEVKDAQISGTIINYKNEPVSNASVLLKGTQVGVSSNDKGNFTLNVPEGNYTIVVSSMGYQTRSKKIKVNVTKKTNLNFTLKQSSETLDNVVIKGYAKQEKLILESKSATKSNISLMNTPAPIVVVGGYLLDQQGNTTIQEGIRNISGVTQAGNNYGIGDNLIIRGLDANYAYDGMYGGGSLGNTFNPTRSQTNIERIEVLKGPSAGLYGMGAAGGVINLIEKKPLDFEQYLVQAQIGQWDHYRLMVDFTGPITDKLSYRIVSASESEEGYRGVSSERFETYGALNFKANKHKFTLSSAYIEDEVQIDAIGNPVRLITTSLLDDPENGGYDWENLVNDATVDNNGDFVGLQLTDEQRQILANSLESTDGFEPFDIGDETLVSPLSTPNTGREFRIKL